MYFSPKWGKIKKRLHCLKNCVSNFNLEKSALELTHGSYYFVDICTGICYNICTGEREVKNVCKDGQANCQ